MRRSKSRVTALVGAQLGSEGKGVVAYALANRFQAAVRTGGPNAGHSIVHEGKLYKMQTIPCGWVNPNCQLILGAGALINLEVLEHELKLIEQVDPNIRERLLVDAKAGILEDRHHREEGGVDGEIHKRMGSTGEGVGVARRDRIARDPTKFRLAGDTSDFADLGVSTRDTVSILSDLLDRDWNIMLEGTQGCGLSLVHGDWPYVTSQDTNAAQLAADAGIPPQCVTEVILVARTYPIRVAGNSGPLEGELTWQEMSRRAGRTVEERTTVTKKIRRIAEWDEKLFSKAVMLNRPSSVVLTFGDYLDPELRDQIDADLDRIHTKVGRFIDYLERAFAIQVSAVGTGWSETEGWRFINLGLT